MVLTTLANPGRVCHYVPLFIGACSIPVVVCIFGRVQWRRATVFFKTAASPRGRRHRGRLAGAGGLVERGGEPGRRGAQARPGPARAEPRQVAVARAAGPAHLPPAARTPYTVRSGCRPTETLVVGRGHVSLLIILDTCSPVINRVNCR